MDKTNIAAQPKKTAKKISNKDTTALAVVAVTAEVKKDSKKTDVSVASNNSEATLRYKVGDLIAVSGWFAVSGFNTKDNTLELQSLKNSSDTMVLCTTDEVLTIKNATNFSEIVECTRTQLANVLIMCENTPLTLSYNKLLKAEDIVTALADTYPNQGTMLSREDFLKSVKKAANGATKGVLRTMTGYHTGSIDEFGRIQFYEHTTDKDKKSGIKLVDPRTINWIICNNKKYLLKK